MIDIIDVRDRTIVGTHLGQKSKSKNFIECIDRAIKYREADTKGLTIRTDNGLHSQAYIESHHSVIEREFV